MSLDPCSFAGDMKMQAHDDDGYKTVVSWRNSSPGSYEAYSLKFNLEKENLGVVSRQEPDLESLRADPRSDSVIVFHRKNVASSDELLGQASGPQR